MPAGIQIFNDYGTVQIDENAETFVLHSKGTVDLNGSIYDQLVDIPENLKGATRWVRWNTNGQGRPPGFGGDGAMLAFRPRIGSGAYAGIGWGPYGSLDILGYHPTLGTNSILVDWWYFTRPLAAAAGSGAGLEIYRPDGSVAYSSTGGRPMKMMAVANDTGASVNVPYAGDWAVCVGTPFPTVGEYDYNGQFRYQERGIFFQVGSTFVQNQQTIMGCRISNDTSQFILGRNPVATQLLIDVSGL